MGKIEYFTFNGTAFELHTIENVKRMRFIDDKGTKTMREDTDMKDVVEFLTKKTTQVD